MPAGHTLIGMSGAEKDFFLEVRTHKLHPYREVVGIKADRESQTWNTRKVCGQRENIFEVHRQGVTGMFAQFKRSRGCHRAGDDIHFFKRLLKITFDQGANLLRLAIEGIVIPGGKAYVPSMMRRLTSGPNPAPRVWRNISSMDSFDARGPNLTPS